MNLFSFAKGGKVFVLCFAEHFIKSVDELECVYNISENFLSKKYMTLLLFIFINEVYITILN